MSTATITIAQVTPPGPGKKAGTIKDTSGKYWSYFPDKVRPPSEGAVTVDYYDREGTGQYAGKTFSTITAIYTGTNPGPVQRPAPAAAPSAPPPSPRQDNTDERIFVCGIVNNAVRSGAVDCMAASAIVECVEAARSAWRLTFGGGQ